MQAYRQSSEAVSVARVLTSILSFGIVSLDCYDKVDARIAALSELSQAELPKRSLFRH